jgi:hypothetical protein
VSTDGEPPFRPPPERRAWPAIVWIAGTLAAIAALVFLWQPPSSPEAAAALALPSLPSLPDPAAAASEAAGADASGGLPPTAASGTELIEVCGVGWVPPDATGAADLAAVAADRDVLASQRAVLDALRRRDGEVGEAMATVLELFGAGRDNSAGTPWLALLCASAPSSTSPARACAGRDGDLQLGKSLAERLARLATATSDPGVYALAMQQCQWVKGEGSCALLNFDQWARVDDGNALPWLYILQRARDRNDAAQIEEALYHIGAATRYESGPYAIAGKVADRAGAGDVDVVAALLLGEEAIGAAGMRVDPFTALTQVCKGPVLDDANRRQACEHAAETLTERSDSLMTVVVGASIGRRLGWPGDRVDKLRGLQVASADEANSTSTGSFELPSSCSSARRILASFSRKAREGEAQTARAWVASHGGSAAFVAPPLKESTTGRADDAARAEPGGAQAATEAASAPVAAAGVAPPPPEPIASGVTIAAPPDAASAAASAIPYSATPPPDR